jgi:anti-repressor protein
VSKLSDLENAVHRLSVQLETITSDSGNFTIKAYARLKGVVGLDRQQASKLGKRASELCRQRGISPGRTLDETFGYVQNYPERILEEVFKGASLLN